MPQTISKSRKAQTQSPGGGKTTGQLVRESNRWRDNYNPLRSLVISRVVTILEAAERGDYAELQLVMRKLEKRYPVLKGLKARRLAALEKLDWDIKVMDPLPEGATEAMAKEQEKFLRSRYELVGNLTEAFGHLATAEFRGYAILQKHRVTVDPTSQSEARNDGAVRELHWLPHDQFSRDGQFGDFFYNQDSQFGIGLDSCAQTLGEENRIGGEQLPREEFLIREVQDPLYEIALIAFVNWAMGRKDYAAFVEIFGLPNAIVIMPPNIPQGKENEYRGAAEKVADGVSGALPNGSDAKFPTAGIRGSNAPFKEYCDAQDADVVLAGTGGRLSMLTADKGGLGDGPAEEHADAFDEIAQADARKINQTFQTDFDKLELEQQFPGQPRLAYFELCAVEEEEATSIVDRVVKLEQAGLQTDVAEVSEMVGLKLTRVNKADPKPGEQAPNPGNDPNADPDPNASPSPGGEGRGEGEPITNRNGSGSASTFAQAVAAKLDPVAALLNRITEIKDDAQMVATLAHFLAQADAITQLVTADVSRAANALEQETAAALAKGLATK